MTMQQRVPAPPGDDKAGDEKRGELAALIGVLREKDALQLAHRVSRAARRDGRLVQMIGPQGREGTSSLARDLAIILAMRAHAPVLLLDLDLPANGHLAWFRARGVATRLLPELMAEADEAPPAGEGGGQTGIAPGMVRLHALVGTTLVVSEQVLPAGQASIPPELLARLRTEFSQVVVDSPPLATSFEGVALSADMDATVVVLRAERTRAPVARDICERLVESGAQLVGFVFNRRRRLIPSFLYRRLW